MKTTRYFIFFLNFDCAKRGASALLTPPRFRPCYYVLENFDFINSTRLLRASGNAVVIDLTVLKLLRRCY